MNKIPCVSQDTEAKILPVDVCIFGHFGWLSPTAIHSADCKTFFCITETVANNALNHWHVVVYNRLWVNVSLTLNTAFSLTNVHAKWWIHCLLISSTHSLSHATSIYCCVFLCFPGQLPNFGDLSIQHHLCLYDHV